MRSDTPKGVPIIVQQWSAGRYRGAGECALVIRAVELEGVHADVGRARRAVVDETQQGPHLFPGYVNALGRVVHRILVIASGSYFSAIPSQDADVLAQEGVGSQVDRSAKRPCPAPSTHEARRRSAPS